MTSQTPVNRWTSTVSRLGYAGLAGATALGLVGVPATVLADTARDARRVACRDEREASGTPGGLRGLATALPVRPGVDSAQEPADLPFVSVNKHAASGGKLIVEVSVSTRDARNERYRAEIADSRGLANSYGEEGATGYTLSRVCETFVADDSSFARFGVVPQSGVKGANQIAFDVVVRRGDGYPVAGARVVDDGGVLNFDMDNTGVGVRKLTNDELDAYDTLVRAPGEAFIDPYAMKDRSGRLLVFPVPRLPNNHEHAHLPDGLPTKTASAVNPAGRYEGLGL